MKRLYKIALTSLYFFAACADDNTQNSETTTATTPAVTGDTGAKARNAAGSMVGALDSAKKLSAEMQKKIIKVVSLDPRVVAVDKILQQNKESLHYSVYESKAKKGVYVVEVTQQDDGQKHFIAEVDAKSMQLLELHELSALLGRE